MKNAWRLLLAIALVTVSAAETKKSMVGILVGRMQQLYGDEAPRTVTFVSRLEIRGESGPKGIQPSKRAKPLGRNAQDFSDTEPEEASTRVGDIATGVVLLEEKGDLYLDTNPCNGRVVVFRKPYRKSAIGSITCGTKELTRVQIEQKK